MKALKRYILIFIELLRLDLKRSLCRRNLIVVACFLGISIFLVQWGVNEYRLLEADKANFEHMEAVRFGLQENYDQYGSSGLRYFFLPSPVCIFFGTPAVFKRIEASIDDKTKLDVHTSLLNGSAFDNLSADFLSYSGFLLYAGSLLFLLFGYEDGRDREYMKFLSALSGGFERVTTAIFTSRVFLIVVFVFVVTGAALATVAVNGISLTPRMGLDFVFGFSFSTIFYYIFFFLLGTLAGAARSKLRGLGALFAIWVVLLFVVPGVVGKYAASRAQRTSPMYDLEMKRLHYDALVDNKWMWEPGRENTLYYKVKEFILLNLFPRPGKPGVGYRVEDDEVNKFEKGILDGFADSIRKTQDLMALFPTTFYLSLSYEAGGRGYGNLNAFFIHARNRQILFRMLKPMREIAAREGKPMHRHKAEVEAIIKKINQPAEQVFHAYPGFPLSYTLGKNLLIIYTLALLIIGSRRSRISIFGSYFQRSSAGDMEITVASGEKRMFKAPPSFIGQCVNRALRLHNRYKGKLSLAGQNIDDRETDNFIYLGSPDCLPEYMKVGSFFHFVQRLGRLTRREKKGMKEELKRFRRKRFKDLGVDERAEVISRLMRFTGLKIWMLVDFVNCLTLEGIRRFDRHLEGLLAECVSVLYFNTHPNYDPPLSFNGCTLITEEENRYELKNLK